MDLSTLLIFQNIRLPLYQQQVADCAAQIMTRYSEVQSSIVYTYVGSIIDDILSNEMPNTTRIVNMHDGLNYGKKKELEPYNMLTLIISDIDELETYFDVMYRILGWNSQSKHFIIYFGDQDVNRIFQICWDKFIIKIIVLDVHLNIYRYFPLQGNNPNVVQHKLMFECKDLDFTYTDEVYEFAGFHDFKGYEVRVLTAPLVPYVIDVNDHKQPGFEIVMLRELSKQLNFTIKYIEHHFDYWGYKSLDDTYSNMYSVIFDRKADIMLGMLAANGTFLYDFDSTNAHTTTDLTFFVPPPKRLHQWENVIKVYQKLVWTVILMLMILIGALWYMIGKCRQQNEGFNNVIRCVLYVTAITCGESIRQPITFSFRIIFVTFTFYNLIITSTFESSVMVFLTKPVYEKSIKDINGLINSKLPIGGYGYAQELFSAPGDGYEDYYSKIYNNWQVCEMNEYCANQTAFKRNRASLYEVRQINYLTPKYYLNTDGSSKLQRMPTISSFYMWILMLKGYPLKNYFDIVIQRFKEYGFCEKWIEDVNYNVRANDNIKHVPLSFEHIVFPIGVLIVGCSLGILMFIIELLHYHWHNNKNKIKDT